MNSEQSPITIPSSTSYFDGDYFFIVGEISNNSDIDQGPVRVTCTIYDENNTVIGTSTSYTEPTIILPHYTAPFKLILGSSDVSSMNQINRYKIDAFTG